MEFGDMGRKKVKLYEGADAVEGADIALKARLYINGWQLYKDLMYIRESAKRFPNNFSVAISFNGEIAVAVAVRRSVFLQAFCRAAERRNGHASACISKIRKHHSAMDTTLYACNGIEGSGSFWSYCLIRST